MKFIIIGKQGAGKSTFGRFLADSLHTQSTDTSQWLIEVETARQQALADRYNLSAAVIRFAEARMLGTELQDNIHSGWDPERNRPIRELLVALGDAVNSVNPTFLVDRCFERGLVATGVRRKSELRAIRKKYPDALVVYIDREGGSQQKIDNFELEKSDANLVIRVNTLAESAAAATSICSMMGLSRNFDLTKRRMEVTVLPNLTVEYGYSEPIESLFEGSDAP